MSLEEEPATSVMSTLAQAMMGAKRHRRGDLVARPRATRGLAGPRMAGCQPCAPSEDQQP